MQTTRYIMSGAAGLLLLNSCVKDELYKTPHPDKGRITITADWSHRSTDCPLPEEYVFQNSTGGAYLYGTFRKQMMKYCEKYGIGDGTYQFKSHDYRHTLATMFYDNGTSIQSVRDYLGHDFEEMTQQYIDYMPKKISKANKEYLSKEENSLAAGIKRCKRGK